MGKDKNIGLEIVAYALLAIFLLFVFSSSYADGNDMRSEIESRPYIVELPSGKHYHCLRLDIETRIATECNVHRLINEGVAILYLSERDTWGNK